MSVITDNAAIDAKAQAELVVVLSRLGVPYDRLTDLGRILFQSGYKIGYAAGALDSMRGTRASLGAKE